MKNAQRSLKRKLSVLAMAAALVSHFRLRSASAIVAIFYGGIQATSAAPATYVQTVTYEGETITMRLNKENLRSANFELLSQNAAGTYDVITPVEERSYMGTVDGYPGAVSCGVLLDNGTFKGAVYFDRGVSWFTEGNSVTATRATDYGTYSNFQLSTVSSVTAGQAGSTMYGYELGIDADYNYFTSRGSNMASCLETIEYSVCVVRAIYMRDALLRPYLGRVVVRSTLAHDPYTATNGTGFLSAVKTEWETNHSDTDPDLVAGISPTQLTGGWGWVGTVGTASGYSVNRSSNGDFNVLFRHEMGHNWGCSHHVGGVPEGSGIMGGNGPGRFSGPELYRILSHRDSRIAAGGVLDAEGTYTSIELPPYASLDLTEFTQVSDLYTVIEILANDHDANGQAISLVSYDSTSAQGGTVTRQGDSMVYTAPSGDFLGVDYFTYKITDTTGKTATGISTIHVKSEDSSSLRFHLELDETSGDSAADASSYGNSGSLSNLDFDTRSVPGKLGNALTFSSDFEFIEASNIESNSNTTTLTAWIKQGAAANQRDYAGILLGYNHANTSGASGLLTGSNGELRYMWNGNESDWDSGLTPPADTWTFIALVIKPTQATIYMDSGSGMQSATHVTNHDSATFEYTNVGWTRSTWRTFLGTIDDVRIYDEAMSTTALQAVQIGGGIETPSPFDGAWGVQPVDLSWTAAINTTRYHVYLGTDKTVVQNATTASAEYLGAVTSPTYSNPTLDPMTSYYWRVDTEKPDGTITGEVWKFTRGSSSRTPIINPSFELPNTTKLHNWESVPGWSSDSVAADSGVESGQTPTDGSWTGFLGEPDPSVWNLTDQTIAAGETYTLKVDAKKTAVSASAIRIMLYYDNAGTRTTVATHDAAISDDMQEVSLVFNADDHPSAIGKKIGIEIDNVAGAWLGFDNVRLTSTGVPSTPPSWTSNPFIKTAALENVTYSGSLVTNASDSENDTLTFTKVSGPEWLQIAEDGTLSGTPLLADIGEQSWEVSVTDLFTAPAIATLNITVTDSPDAPVFTSDPFTSANATKYVAYSASIAGSATDDDIADTLSYSKTSGPAWLIVAPDGTLSGTPRHSDVGLNAFTVSADDGNSTPVTATLNITVDPIISLLFSDDFERPASSTIGNGWIEQSNDSRIYDTSNTATKMVISQSAGTPFAIVQQLSSVYVDGESYSLEWSAARAAGSNGTLIYDVSIGTWDGATFTPLAAQADSITNVNISSKVAGPAVNFTATATEASQQLAVRFEVVTGSSDWTGFDDISITTTAEIDSDGDSIPDSWETANGLNPNVNDRSIDADGDGFDNWYEYMTDTDPQSQASRQTFTTETAPSSQTLRFSTSVNRRYTVYHSENLLPNSWLPLAPAVPGTGSEMTISDNSPITTKRFYRLQIDLP